MTVSLFGKSLAAGLMTALCLSAGAAADEVWDLKLFGRAIVDYSMATADTADFDLSSYELRTGRIGVSGKSGKSVFFKLELATDSSGELFATDAFLGFTPDGSDWTLLAGQFKTPNSLEEENSSRFFTMKERPAFTDAFALDRRVGIAVSTRRDDWTFMAGLYGGSLNDTAFEEGWVAAARATYTPVQTETLIIHLGGSFRYRQRGDKQDRLRYRQKPFAHQAGRIISTGRLGDNDMFHGIETAALSGGGWLAGEYAWLAADCPACSQGDPVFTGYYMASGWMWGGKRSYRNGKFDRPMVVRPVTQGGHGAFAVAARFDALDLTDAGTDGGTLDTSVLGLDWYPTEHTRIGLNLFRTDAAMGTFTSGLDPAFAAQVMNGTASDKVHGATLRLQFDF